jgi:hypothetical protein
LVAGFGRIFVTDHKAHFWEYTERPSVLVVPHIADPQPRSSAENFHIVILPGSREPCASRSPVTPGHLIANLTSAVAVAVLGAMLKVWRM